MLFICGVILLLSYSSHAESNPGLGIVWKNTAMHEVEVLTNSVYQWMHGGLKNNIQIQNWDVIKN